MFIFKLYGECNTISLVILVLVLVESFLFTFLEGNNSSPNLTFIFGKLYSPHSHGTHRISFLILSNFWHKTYKFMGFWHFMQVKLFSNFNFELINDLS